MEKRDLRLAVLIDADNVPSANLKEMLEEITRYGIPTFKRIYADWTKPHVNRWKTLLLENAITPIQQYSYTTGKNATDSAMIIDAMDILYTGRVDGFCIVSSDSDFTRLALRLREAGMMVIGMGENKTPAPFISACDKFIYIEILGGEDEEEEPRVAGQPASKPKAEKAGIRQIDKQLTTKITSAISDLADETGWVFLGELGNLLLKKQPDFDPRNYGYKKLLHLIKSVDLFDIDERITDKGNGNIRHVYVKIRPEAEKRKPVKKARSRPAPRPE
jgi:uncharacterized LabA/DUF88 family protein